jgi:hypothetical protein
MLTHTREGLVASHDPATVIFIKGTVSRDFLLLILLVNQFPPSPRVFHLDCFKFFQKFAEIFAAQGLPPVDTGGKWKKSSIRKILIILFGHL